MTHTNETEDNALFQSPALGNPAEFKRVYEGLPEHKKIAFVSSILLNVDPENILPSAEDMPDHVFEQLTQSKEMIRKMIVVIVSDLQEAMAELAIQMSGAVE